MRNDMAKVVTEAPRRGHANPRRISTLTDGRDGLLPPGPRALKGDTAFKCLSQAEVERAPLNRFLVERGRVRYETRTTTIGFGTSASCPALGLTPDGKAA